MDAVGTKKWKGFHTIVTQHEDLQTLKKVVAESLAPMGVNAIVLECNNGFTYKSHPEVSDGTVTQQDAHEFAKVCRDNGVKLIPLYNCLGHQSWAGKSNGLLAAHPEFDETPGVPMEAKWPDFYCRSWCPSHPYVNSVVFDLIDELIEAFEADYFHVGMDEVFVLADETCPRCKGKNRAKLFAEIVNEYYRHIVETKKVKMLMWADRLLDDKKMGYGEWESDIYGTWAAIDEIPRDILLVDWHYEKTQNGYPSIPFFLKEGFSVWPACWKNPEAAMDFIKDSEIAASEIGAQERMAGMLVTGWGTSGRSLAASLLDEDYPDALKKDGDGTDDIIRTLKTVIGKL